MLPVSRVIGHKEWAPGRKTDPLYDMNWRRREVAAFTPGGPDMPLSGDDRKFIYESVWGGSGTPLWPVEGVTPAGADGEWPRTTVMSMAARISRDFVAPQIAALRNELLTILGAQGQASAPAAAPVAVDVDATAVAAALVPALAADAGFIAALATAINDDADRRARDGNPGTGPTS